MKNCYDKSIAIIGAGPTALVLALHLKKLGFCPTIFEKKTRYKAIYGDVSRSINITLSERGMRVLNQIDCKKAIVSASAKVAGRSYNPIGSEKIFLPYTKRSGYCLYSIKRWVLIKTLLEAVEKEGIMLRFEHNFIGLQDKNQSIVLRKDGEKVIYKFNYTFGADGANSEVRKQALENKTYSEVKNEYTYKKIDITAERARILKLRPDVVNIWPIQYGMFLTLPNLDGSHSGLLHVKKKYVNGINQNATKMQKLFEDLCQIVPDFVEQFIRNGSGEFLTVKCNNWTFDRGMLIGDAAHSIVPFYGQGTNCGLEDVSILYSHILDCGGDLQEASTDFEKSRIRDTDAIADLSERNLKNLEIKNLYEYEVLKRLELDLELQHTNYSSEYFEVAFTTIPYHKIIRDAPIKSSVLKKHVTDRKCRHTHAFCEACREKIYQEIETRININHGEPRKNRRTVRNKPQKCLQLKVKL